LLSWRAACLRAGARGAPVRPTDEKSSGTMAHDKVEVVPVQPGDE
jgi:hypothetical protein